MNQSRATELYNLQDQEWWNEIYHNANSISGKVLLIFITNVPDMLDVWNE